MKRRYLEIVYILWVDSEAEVGWEEVPSEVPPFECNRTVGFLLSEDMEKYVVAGDYDQENDHSNRRMSIPKVAVKKFRTVTIVPLKQKPESADSEPF